MQAWTKKNKDKADLAAAGALDAEQQKAMADAPMIVGRPLMAAYLQGAAFMNGGLGLLSVARAELNNDERITKAFLLRIACGASKREQRELEKVAYLVTRR